MKEGRYGEGGEILRKKGMEKEGRDEGRNVWRRKENEGRKVWRKRAEIKEGRYREGGDGEGRKVWRRRG